MTSSTSHKKRQHPPAVLEVLASRHTTVPMQRVRNDMLAASHAAHMDWIERYVKAWGGRCHETYYNGDRKYKLPLECAKGHRFAFSYHRLSKGAWCLQCLNDERRLGMAVIHQMAAERNATCLSTEYTDNLQLMHWRCEHGHEWWASAGSVRSGHWCPVCGHTKYTIQAIKAIAQQHGGVCLSEEYDRRKKFKFRCAHGHEFEKSVQSAVDGRWCVQCYHDRMRAHSLKDLQEFAQKRGGLCLTTTYHNIKQLIEWQCVAGHRWKRAWGGVLIIKHEWCPICRAAETEQRRKQARKHRTVGIPKRI